MTPSLDDNFEVSAIVPAGADQRLAWERELLGLYLSDHPLRRIASTLAERVDTTIGELGPHLEGLIANIGGTAREVRAFVPRKSTTGQRMAFIQLEDLTGSCEVVVFPRLFEECAELLRPDAIIVIRGRVEGDRPNASSNGSDEDGEKPPVKIIAEGVYALDDPRLLAWKKNATVQIQVRQEDRKHLATLRAILEEHKGMTPVTLLVESKSSFDEIVLGDELRIETSAAFERAVENLLGRDAYSIEVLRTQAAQTNGFRAKR